MPRLTYTPERRFQYKDTKGQKQAQDAQDRRTKENEQIGQRRMADQARSPVRTTHPARAGSPTSNQNGGKNTGQRLKGGKIKTTITDGANNTRSTPLTVEIAEATGRSKALQEKRKVELDSGAHFGNNLKSARLHVTEAVVITSKPNKIFATPSIYTKIRGTRRISSGPKPNNTLRQTKDGEEDENIKKGLQPGENTVGKRTGEEQVGRALRSRIAKARGVN